MEVIEYLSEDGAVVTEERRTVDVYNYLDLGTRLHQIQHITVTTVRPSCGYHMTKDP